MPDSDSSGDPLVHFSTRALRARDLRAVKRRWPNAPSRRELDDLAAGSWLLLEDDEPRGYAVLLPLPGLPRLFELQGDVNANTCRHGGAVRLLQAVLDGLNADEVDEVSYAVHSLQSDAARFLLDHGFRLGHEEWQMLCDLPPAQPRAPLPDGYALRTLPRLQALALFLRLYEDSFSPTPWYQPYSRAEVTADLVRTDDLLFLYHKDTPVGFVWMREHSRRAEGEIEPVGVISAHQKKGAGRALLLEALWQLSERGMRQAVLGVWRQNEGAIHLYQSAGFHREQRRYYLVYKTPSQDGAPR
ncbi:MAG TPA: N-acetyltransferase [Candidatus Binatia bacterium]|jgi:mycothiol synthase|nr:N-acetyltransferase [Candidatus Binatia bacterium]